MKDAIRQRARELGFDVSKETPELSAMLKKVKTLENEGYEFEAADGSLALLIRRALRHETKPFAVTDGQHDQRAHQQQVPQHEEHVRGIEREAVPVVGDHERVLHPVHRDAP